MSRAFPDTERLGFVIEEEAVINRITDEKKLLLGYRNYIKQKL